MAKPIGPTFGTELKVAGLAGMPFSWGSDGDVQFAPQVSQQQRDQVMAVIAAHDGTKSAGADPVQDFLDDLRKTPGKLAKLKAVIEKS